MTVVDVHQTLFPSGVSFVCLIDWESEKERDREGSIRLLDQVFACSLARSHMAFFLYCYYYDYDDDNDDRRWMR